MRTWKVGKTTLGLATVGLMLPLLLLPSRETIGSPPVSVSPSPSPSPCAGSSPVPVRYYLGNDPTHWQESLQGNLCLQPPSLHSLSLHTESVDPVLLYATFFGGGGRDEGWAVAADAQGNTYITGITFSTAFFSSTPPSVDDKNVFIARINADGRPGYLTILGGISGEEGNAIGVDMFGNAYVAGETFSPDFPVLNAWQPHFAGYEDAYVLKLDPEGRLVWSTFIGGTGAEEIDDIYVDAAGNVYTAGEVYSDDFPLLNPWQSRTYGPEDEDAFISIFNANGQLVYSTYIAAEERDQIFRITVGPDGYIYATGMTSSPSFPTVNPFQPWYGGGWDDAFVLKLDPWNNQMLYSTFLGGIDRDEGWGIAVDGEGNAYVAGRTNSPNFPLAHPWQSHFGGGDYDAFLAKVSPQGNALLFSTFIGGPGPDEAWGLAMDSGEHVYITGLTGSPAEFPLRNALQPYYGGGEADGFLVVADKAGNLLQASFLGGIEKDIGWRLVVDEDWVVHITGATDSPDFPTRASLHPYLGNMDAFVGRAGLIPTPTPTPTPTPFASRTVGPEGGALWMAYPGHLTLLRVPPAGVSAPTVFTLTYDSRPDAQGDLQGLNHFFRIEADGPVTPPLQVALGFNETRGVIADTIDLYQLSGTLWLTEGITVTERYRDYLEAYVESLGIYGLLGRTNHLYLPLVLRQR